jgi:hypothetical protein
MVILVPKFKINLHSIKVIATSILWFIAILTFLKFLNFISISTLLYLILSYVIIDIFNKETSILFHLPFITLLSPIFGRIGFFNLLLSDYFVLVLFFYMITRGYNKLRILKFNKTALFIFFALLISVILNFAFENLVTLKPAISIIQIVIICVCTKILTRNIDELNNILFYWLISIILVSILMLGSFYHGINLNDVDLDLSIDVNEYKNTISENVFRISYFYSNIAFALGSGVFIALMLIYNANSFLKKIFLTISFLLLLLVLLLSGMKTSIFLILFIISIFSFQNKIVNNLKYILLIIIGYLLFSIFVLNDITRILFYERFTSGTSFYIRLGVYKNALIQFIKYPFNWLFGLGPEFLSATGNKSKSTLFFINSTTGVEEGTVDSTYVSILIEYGILVFVLLINYLISLISVIIKLSKKLKKYKYFKEFVSLSSIILLFSFGGFTQVIGLSKISWLFFQCLVLFEIHYNKTILKNIS